MEQGITASQMRMLHMLLNKGGLMEYKPEMVSSVSEGRTTHAHELTAREAREICCRLKSTGFQHKGTEARKETLIRKIWGIATELEIIYGDTVEDGHMNAAKLDLFCKQRGTVKKPLRGQSVAELAKTCKQFEAMATHSRASNSRKSLLQGLVGQMKEAAAQERYEACAVLKKEIERLTPKGRKR